MAGTEGRRESLEGAIVPRPEREVQDGSRGELEVRIASELLERARAEGAGGDRWPRGGRAGGV